MRPFGQELTLDKFLINFNHFGQVKNYHEFWNFGICELSNIISNIFHSKIFTTLGMQGKKILQNNFWS